ncbi:uncharacterized protein N7525_006533 [Penicillium rubens]|uniref:uncharacterized protein n=1 Tax=Penicillium rubens TaxID=1108849 RepID=UPI002A5B110E|nr:uncharacterized protein N7525_006533 [Penicillium rubens]KAJ5828280.1 hypothetical protein N7525_006533 [Penicillium rubens]KAJ5841992.1 hypothetical protein N7534_011822 [Penicillium rubens]
MTSIIVPSLGKKEAIFPDVVCALHNMPSCKILGSTGRGNKNLSQRVLYHTRETRLHAHAMVSVVWAFVGSRDLFIGCRLFLDIPQLLFAPAFDTRPLVSRMIAIVLVGETCDFYRSNALTYQPISSWHGGDVLSRF